MRTSCITTASGAKAVVVQPASLTPARPGRCPRRNGYRNCSSNPPSCFEHRTAVADVARLVEPGLGAYFQRCARRVRAGGSWPGRARVRPWTTSCASKAAYQRPAAIPGSGLQSSSVKAMSDCRRPPATRDCAPPPGPAFGSSADRLRRNGRARRQAFELLPVCRRLIRRRRRRPRRARRCPEPRARRSARPSLSYRLCVGTMTDTRGEAGTGDILSVTFASRIPEPAWRASSCPEHVPAAPLRRVRAVLSRRRRALAGARPRRVRPDRHDAAARRRRSARRARRRDVARPRHRLPRRRPVVAADVAAAGVERADQRRLAAPWLEVRPDVVSIWHMGALSTGLITTLVRSGLPLVYVVCDDWLTYTAKIDPWMQLVRRPPPPGTGGGARRGCAGHGSRPRRQRRRSASSATSRDGGPLEHTHVDAFPSPRVTYSGIDERDFPIADRGQRTRPWRWRLLHVGRLDPRKGIETAVRALAHLPGEATASTCSAPATSATATTSRRSPASSGSTTVCASGRSPRSALPGALRRRRRPALPDRLGGAVRARADSRRWRAARRWSPPDAAARASSSSTGPTACGSRPGDAARARRPPSHAWPTTRRCGAGSSTAGVRTAAELTVGRLAEVLEAWHLAAADRFRSGTPAPSARRSPR